MNKKLVMLTCYDRAFAKMLTKSESIDYLLVGDSLGMVLYGEKSTASVPLRWMIDHTRAVRRGVKEGSSDKPPLVVGDMPAGTYDRPEQAVKTAMQLKEAGADLVKLEGPLFDQVKALKDNDFRVVTHLGLTPQTAGSFKLQAKEAKEADELFEQALKLADLGSDLLVLEMVPSDLAKRVTEALPIPSIGIGAGSHCTGQVLVLYDMLGFDPDFSPKFLRRFMDGSQWIQKAVTDYSDAVRRGDYPSESESYSPKSSPS